MSQPMPAQKSVNRLREMLPSRHILLPFLMRLSLAAPIVFLGVLNCLLIPRLKDLFAILHWDASQFQRLVLSFGCGFQAVALSAGFAAIWILFRGKGPTAYNFLSCLLLFLMIETALLGLSAVSAAQGLGPAIRM
ncbi:MAG: hypothetical protein WCL04_06225 [Verrucomicrobiota bacterium]